MAESAASAPRIAAAKRRTEALALRLEGKTFKAIGDAMSCSEQRAHRMVTQELARLNARRAEAADEVTRLECERLDALLAAVMPGARQGKVRHIDRVLAIMQRRAKLLGLDKPSRREIGNLGGTPFKVYGTGTGFNPESV